MKFFLDTADISELRYGAASGIIDGVTTNPSLMAKTGRKMEEVIREITEIIDGPISVEVLATEADAMVTEGKKYSAMHKNVVVKLPMTEAGIQATRRLSKEGIKVNLTLIFSAAQALLGAKAGATYVSPFIGRLDDINADGMELIKDIKQIYTNYGFKTQILAASIRHPVHILQAAKVGADVATLPTKIFKQLFDHPLTKAGLEKFLADWKAAPQNK